MHKIISLFRQRLRQPDQDKEQEGKTPKRSHLKEETLRQRVYSREIG